MDMLKKIYPFNKMSEQLFNSNVNNIVPWQAVYSFPTQSTKMQRQTVKLPPKNGGTFGSGDSKTIRIEFPSDGYMNCLKSYLAFDFIGSPTLPSVSGCTLTSTLTNPGNTTAVQTRAFSLTFPASYNGTTTASAANLFVGSYLVFERGPRRKQILQIQAHGQATTNNTILPSVTFVDDPIIFNAPAGTSSTTTTASFSVTFYPGARLQEGGIHELFREVATMYGGRDFTRIKEYSTLAGALIKGGQSLQWRSSASSITDGAVAAAAEPNGDSPLLVNSASNDLAERLQFFYSATAARPRRVAINLFDGVLNLRKLLALNWMAAQFAIELTLHDAKHAIQSSCDSSVGFSIQNVEYVTELFYFDSVYDVGFLMGLKNDGIPMKYSSWNYHTFALTGSKNQLQIQDRARSVKYAIAVIRDANPTDITKDSNRFYYDGAVKYLTPASAGTTEEQRLWNAGLRAPEVSLQTGQSTAPVKSFQWRVGGKYYPAQPVLCRGGGAEAYMELLKVFDGMGDFTFGHVIGDHNWGGDVLGTVRGGNNFMIAMKFEHEDMADNISGINAEEQSDLLLDLEFEGPVQDKRCDIFVCYDALLILRDGNSVQKVM